MTENILSPEESTQIHINGVGILFNVLHGKLIAISNAKFTDCVNSFVERWSISENTENLYKQKKSPLLITTPDNIEHNCTFVCESMIEGDTRITTNICSIEGIENLKNDYLEEFNVDIGRDEILDLIIDAVMSDSICETWEDYKLSFLLTEKEKVSCPLLRSV